MTYHVELTDRAVRDLDALYQENPAWGEKECPEGRPYLNSRSQLLQGRRVDALGIVVKKRVRKLKGLLLVDLAIEDHSG